MKAVKTIKDVEIAKRVNACKYYDVDAFNESARAWCKAVKEGRMLATVVQVSRMGTSRQIKILELRKSAASKRFYKMNYNQFLKVLGFRLNERGDVVISGCGMDMIYHISYRVANTLRYLGILSNKEFTSLPKELVVC